MTRAIGEPAEPPAFRYNGLMITPREGGRFTRFARPEYLARIGIVPSARYLAAMQKEIDDQNNREARPSIFA